MRVNMADHYHHGYMVYIFTKSMPIQLKRKTKQTPATPKTLDTTGVERLGLPCTPYYQASVSVATLASNLGFSFT